jgi:hypothetical protein
MVKLVCANTSPSLLMLAGSRNSPAVGSMTCEAGESPSIRDALIALTDCPKVLLRP